MSSTLLLAGDSWLDNEDHEDYVGICCMCNEELYSADEVIIHNEELYCNYDCLRSEIGTFETEVVEDTSCSFCGEILIEGQDAITDLDGSVFCDESCVYGGYDIVEVYGYDL